jgi:hypothetical protein
MTLKGHGFAFPRRVASGVCIGVTLKGRVQGMPDAVRTRGLVCKMQKETHTRRQVQTEQSGIPCAMV